MYSSLDMSNTDISQYLLISKNVVLTNFLVTFLPLVSQTTDISMEIFWDQKIYLEISVVWGKLIF